MNIRQWQKKYPDTIKVLLITKDPMTMKAIREMLDGRTLLQGKVTNTRTIIYMSKLAAEQGVSSVSPIFEIALNRIGKNR